MHTRASSDGLAETGMRGPVMALGLVAAILVAGQALMAHLSPRWLQAGFTSVAEVLPVVALLGMPGLIALAATPLLSRVSGVRAALWLMLATGLAMRLVWWGVPIGIDDDYFRYLWDGAVLASGHNPYAIAPAAVMAGDTATSHLATLAARAGPILHGINFPELTTIYPGTAQIAFALAYVVAPLSNDGLRVVFLGADLATLALLVATLREMGRPVLLASLYWLNPLVVWSGFGTIHSEALLAPLLLGTLLCAWRGHDMLSAVLLALAVGVKLWPVLMVPMLARLAHASGRRLLAPAAAFAFVSALLLGPLALSALSGLRSGLVAYSDHWWTNNAPFSWISYGVYRLSDGDPLGQRLLRAAVAFAVATLALLVARKPPLDLRQLLLSATTLAATTFYLAPAQFPWYALWFLPLAAAVESRPLLLASASLATYYLLLPLANQGAGEVHNYGLAFLHALPVWAWLAWTARATREPIGASSSSHLTAS
ncbi:MAG: glycosyltransferase 87 family protein [Hyphomicrobiaceae bacterium]